MVLLSTCYRYGSLLEYDFNLQFNGFWSIYMVKLCLEKMLILRCILPKNEPPTKNNDPPS